MRRVPPGTAVLDRSLSRVQKTQGAAPSSHSRQGSQAGIEVQSAICKAGTFRIAEQPEDAEEPTGRSTQRVREDGALGTGDAR